MPTDVIPFAVEHSEIEDLEILRMKQITDERGTVREFYRESSFLEAGLPSLGPWLQVNITETRQGALRGLHGEEMFKLVAIVEGEARSPRRTPARRDVEAGHLGNMRTAVRQKGPAVSIDGGAP